MTVSTTTASQTFAGNGIATAFPCDFMIVLATDITVSFVNPTTGTQTPAALGTDYTLSGVGNAIGFTLTTTVPVPTGTNLLVQRTLPYNQPTDFTNQGAFFPTMHQSMADRLEMQIQQIATQNGLNMSMPPGLLPAPSTQLPIPQAGSLLGWDATGQKIVNTGTSGVGAGNIADVNVSPTAGIQASKLSFQQSGTGAVVRTVQSKEAELWSYKDFGAKMDGVTDDTAAMNALIAACAATGKAKRVFVPQGVSVLSGAFIITTPILFVGEGQSGGADGTIPATTGSSFKYTGTAGVTFFTLSKINIAGGGFQNIQIDCNGLAAVGLDLEDVLGTDNCVAIVNYTNVGLKLGAPTQTCSWNTFRNLFLGDGGHGLTGKAALWLTGVVGGGNACHNSFVNTHINISGAMHGIYLGGCDNNSFLMTYIYRVPGGTGHGVHVDPTEQTNFPVNNTFFHLEAMGGWYQPSSTVSLAAHIYGYMLDNGEPIPSLSSNGSNLLACPDIVYPLTVSAGAGWSGGAPTFAAYYTINGRVITVAIYVSGTSFVAAANATITGVPVNNGNYYGLGVVSGINQTNGGSISGFVSASTLTIQSGIASTNAAQIMATYMV